MTFKFSTSLAKGLKLKVRKISELIPTFVNVTKKKHIGIVGGGGGGRVGGSPLILNRVKRFNSLVHLDDYLKASFLDIWLDTSRLFSHNQGIYLDEYIQVIEH